MRFRIQKLLIPAVAVFSAGVLFAQQGRPPMGPPTQSAWWEYPVTVTSLNLSEAQTKQLNSIKASYRSRLNDLRTAATQAESNLEEMFKQAPSDELKAAAAIDQYANARDNLTREISRLSLKMRLVLTADQWQDLLNLQSGRGPRPGQGRGRKGGPPASTTTPNKVGTGPAISQK